MRKSSIFLFALVLVACGASILTPPTGPGTAYPCGIGGVSCPGNMCCNEGNVCGSNSGFAGCPEGQCCFVGDDGEDFARRPYPQVPEHK